MRIIPRSEWGARYDDGFHDRRLPVDECWLHHSVTIAPDLVTPWDDDYAAVRTLEDIGESRFGAGISYTYAVTPAGLVFTGHSSHRSGAHTLNRNDIAVAIVWVGRYDTREPSEAQIRATAWLLVQCKRDGVLRRARIDGGHGQAPGQSTDCPGGYGRAAIARINTLAAQYERGELDLTQQEDDMPFGGAEADLLLNRPVTIASPGNPKYSETRSVKEWLGLPFYWNADSFHRLARLEVKVDALAGNLGDDEAKLLAAIRSQPTGGQVDVAQLAGALAPMLAAGLTTEQVEDALRSVLRTGVDKEN